MVAKRFVYL